MSEDHGAGNGREVIRPLQFDKPDTGKLLHLADYETVQPSRIVGELRGYWEGLRQGRAIPARADVEPRGIRRALDYAFILERIAPGAARFRLAGRHLIDLMGMEVRGMPICSFLNTSSRGRLSDVLESVFRGPQIAEITLESEAGYGRPALSGQMLLLPLRSDLGDVTRALGCLVTEGEIGQGPRRFDLLTDEVLPVIPGAKVLKPSASASGFAEAPKRWRGKAEVEPAEAPTPSTRRPATQAPGAQAPIPPDNDTPDERRARFRIVAAPDPEPRRD
ncbi:PAS domain-containing protein [Paracoccus shanxieyensis]|uniref:PAS domain-containing protein n=1 Tax=Paracoccus shanxieyensis TaxID=2675752 RepID=A0A6L6IWZ5_9RHOB|nr:PAS domain-containing protein [Paracoccus shanxieyensis]MTH63802.1 PAS domain-containing protein [Paracoccus shanxieyensis]MTH86687.1 PAS domain-containing protein [Paracoccus shanxieyensis]